MQALALVWLPRGRDTSCTPAPVNPTEGRALYTPQRLFGEVGSSSDVLTHEPFLERARLQREQERDASARLALGAYIVARLVDRLLSFETDEQAAEGFRWQLESVRRHVDELPSDEPETAHLAGIVAAVPAEGPPPSATFWKSLTAYAYFLEHEGRLEESLEMLSLAARSQGTNISPNDFAGYALFAGRLNRLLARWEQATACYCAAEEVAYQVGDPLSMLRGRLGQGAVQRGKGNLPAARSTAESVVRQAVELGLPEAEMMAYADLGVIYGLLGLKLDSLKAHYQAFQLSSDELQRMRILGDLGLGLYEIGAFEPARLAFQLVINSQAKLLVRLNALLELMDLEAMVGNRLAFERCRSELQQHHKRMSPSMSVDYHYKLGTAMMRFGKISRAKEAFTTALHLAETHQLNAWYFKIEQARNELAANSDCYPACHKASELSEAPAVREMFAGLREYAEVAIA
jgi:tetratricopeptide (TPR) repeat protein